MKFALKGNPMFLTETALSLVHGIAKLAAGANLSLNAEATIAFTLSAARAIFGNMTTAPFASV